MTIAPIETRYADCRFRSRLEARWAVFFDHLGIAWQYEPEGYLVGAPEPTPYLPDFWLPNPGVWVEVKGAEEQLDVGLIVEAALPHYGLPGTPVEIGGHQIRMLILGPHAEVSCGRLGGLDVWTQPAHTVLSFRKGDLFQGSGWFTDGGIDFNPDGGLVANDGGYIAWAGRGTSWGNWVGGGAALHGGDQTALRVEAAYRAARSARFEHGEQG
jgi:hypothetical protein